MRHIPKSPRKLNYWWSLLYRRIGAESYGPNPAVDQNWPKEKLWVRLKHSVMMRVYLSNWGDRRAFFSGEYHQEDNVFLIECIVRPGDIFVDAGASVGWFTALAARLTGPSGHLYSFEPDPTSVPQIHEVIKANNFKNVKVFEAGLSDREGQATLAGTVSSQKWVSQDSLPQKERGVAIRLVRGDDVLTDLDLSRPVVLKIDVEGHEVHALRGLSRLLERRELAVICEVSREQLACAGSTPEELFNHMKDRGFNVYQFVGIHQTRWSLRRRLQLTQIEAPLSSEIYDVVFLRPGTSVWTRVNSLRADDGARARVAGAAGPRAGGLSLVAM
jgi:FkbM family methyltransferase